MYKIVLIGRNSVRDDYFESLRDINSEILRFSSIKGAFRLFNGIQKSPDLIIIDNEERKNDLFKKFIHLTRNIPKMVLTEQSFNGLSSWLKDEYSFPVSMVSPDILSRMARNLLRYTATIHENNLLKGELNSLRNQVNFFEEISKILASSLSLDEILPEIIKRLKEIVNAEGWSVFIIDEENNELVLKFVEGKKKKRLKNTRFKSGEGIAGWVAREGIPLIVPDISRDKRFSCRIDKTVNEKISSLMCIPIRTREKTIGVLEIINKKSKKPFNKDDLNMMIKAVDHAAIAIERTMLYQKMAELVITDDLTKLFNLRYLNRTLETEIMRCDRYKTSLSVIFMDIDHFKEINDTNGHLVGSKVLVEVAQLLLRSLRTIDIVARYGGDEYVIVLPQTPPQSAMKIAERLRKNIEQNVFLKKEGYFIKLTASFGVASYPESAKSKEELLKLADRAMYMIKNTTRNGVYGII